MFELTYTKVGDYYIPDLILDEPPELDRFVGKCANLRRDYFREHRPATFAALLNSGTILDHLRETEDAGSTRLGALLPKDGLVDTGKHVFVTSFVSPFRAGDCPCHADWHGCAAWARAGAP